MRPHLAVAPLLLILGIAALPAAAQPWQGSAELAVRVTNNDGDPVEGAKVFARLSEGDPESGPAPVATSVSGEALLSGLADGEWFVEISHDGYMLYTAYLDLRAGKKPQVGFSSQVNTERSFSPMKVRFVKTSPSFNRGSGQTRTEERSTREVVREEPPPQKTPPQRADPAEVVRPEPEPAKPESPQGDRPTSAPAPAGEAEEAAPPAPQSPAPGASAPEPAAGEAPTSEPVETSAPEEPTPPPPPTESPQPPVEEELEELPEAPAPEPAVETLPEPSAEPPGTAPEPPTASSEPPSPADPTSPPATEEPSAPEPGTASTAEERASLPPAPEPEDERAPSTPSIPSTRAAPIPRYLRSAAAGSCSECESGEWAVAAEHVAARSGDGPQYRSCPDSFEQDAHRGAEMLADASASRLDGYAGPILTALFRIAPGQERSRIQDLLAPLSEPESYCQLAGVVLPRSAAFSGYVLEAWDSLGGRTCRGAVSCAVGQARWLGEPVIIEGKERIVVYDIFKNRSSRRERRARMTIYFQPPVTDWAPAR